MFNVVEVEDGKMERAIGERRNKQCKHRLHHKTKAADDELFHFCLLISNQYTDNYFDTLISSL